MKKLNRSHGPPHFPPAEGHPLTRKLFLDKKTKFKTFWGPRQLRDDRWCAAVVTHGGLGFDGYIKNPNIYPDSSWIYKPPTDWRPEESPLIPPQVVHINLRIDGAFLDINSRLADFLGIRFFDPEFVNNISDYEPATTEHKRLLSLAEEVKTDIEKIRKGKTWIEINNYNEGSVDNGGGYNLEAGELGTSNDFISPPRLNMVDQLDGDYDHHLFLDVATPFEGIFFGTDFLGIYLGDNNFVPQYAEPAITDFTQTAVWKIITDALPKTANYFYNYSQILFPCDVGTFITSKFYKDYNDTLAAIGGLSIETFPSVTVNFLDQVPDDAFLVVPLESGGYNVFLSGSTEFLTEDVSFELNVIPMIPSGTIFPKVVQWGKDNEIDITMQGDTLTITSKDTLINLIAKHYKFNPETGKDII